MGHADVVWIHLAQDTIEWRHLRTGIPKKAWNFRSSLVTVSF